MMKKIVSIFCVLGMFFLLAGLAIAEISLDLDVSNWDRAYSAGNIVYTSEGLRIEGSGYRKGQIATHQQELNLANATVYMKWKAHGAGYAAYGLRFQDANDDDDLIFYTKFGTTDHSWEGSTLLPDDTWYYTRIVISEDATYKYYNSTGNYDDQGGTLQESKSGTLTTEEYAKLSSAKLAPSFGDNYGGTSAYLLVGEIAIQGSGSSAFKADPTSLAVSVAETKTATITGGTSPYTATSSDTSVATAVVSGSTVSVTGVSDGSATITVTDSNSNTVPVDVAVTTTDCTTELKNVKCFETSGFPPNSGVCRVHSYDGQGQWHSYASGFLVAPDLLLTAWHIFDGNTDGERKESAMKSKVEFFYEFEACNIYNVNQKDKKVRDIESIIDHGSNVYNRFGDDWCLVKLKNAAPTNCEIYKLSPEPVYLSQGIYEIAHPNGGVKRLACGEVIEEFGQIIAFSYFKHNIKNSPGTSGAPIFNANFEVVGIDVGEWLWVIPEALKATIIYDKIEQHLKALVPEAPTVTVKTVDTTVTVAWNEVSTATGYILWWAPYPDLAPASSLDLGNQNQITVLLNPGDAYYVAVLAYNSSGNSEVSNIEYFIIGSSLSVGPSSLSLSSGQTGSCVISGGTSPYSANSSNTSVATASVFGSALIVTGISAGSTTITVSDSASDSATVSVTVSGSTPGTYTNSLGQTFNLLPAGTFTMGSPSDELGRYSDEGPQHQVTLPQPFYMQTTEVTQAQWESVMGSNPSYFSECPTCPVEQVSWNDVQDYITQMNLRGEGAYSLPTEAQWEYAARAGSTTAFYNGGITETGCDYDQNLNAIGWYCYNSDDEIHPVAQKSPNAWGLYDMSGNVWEWCSDWYASDYYSNSPMDDPQGPSTGSYRVARGGSWDNIVRYCRAAVRYYFWPDYRYGSIGFRLVLFSGQQ